MVLLRRRRLGQRLGDAELTATVALFPAERPLAARAVASPEEEETQGREHDHGERDADTDAGLRAGGEAGVVVVVIIIVLVGVGRASLFGAPCLRARGRGRGRGGEVYSRGGALGCGEDFLVLRLPPDLHAVADDFALFVEGGGGYRALRPAAVAAFGGHKVGDGFT